MSEVAVPQRPFGLLAALEEAGAITLNSLTLPPSITPDDYEAIARMLSATRGTMQWLEGDLIVQGEALWGEDAYQYIEALELSETSRIQRARVSTRFPKHRRFEALSWTHHRAVTKFEPEEQDRLLRVALKEGWSKRRLEDEVRDMGPVRDDGRTGYVVERVLDAAEDVWDAAGKAAEGETVCVPAETMESLGRALGQVE